MPTETFLTFGQPEVPADLLPLRAGPLTLLYDPALGLLRRIRLGEREVLRGIYTAVRDHNWGTVPPQVREISRAVQPQAFRLLFESLHCQGQIDFVWRGTITGEANGTLRFRFVGEARSNFRRNRIGFCVLHPVRECAGARARQTRADGRVVECRFPDLIEPQIIGQGRFRDLRAVAHEVAPGLWAEVSFAGEVFEMEDQRNWTDASFKTYCTPLALPFPVEIQAGTQIVQEVELRLTGGAERVNAGLTADEAAHTVRRALPDDGADSEKAGESRAAVAWPPEGGTRSGFAVALPALDSATGRLPRIGLGVASHGEPLTDGEIAWLRRLGLAHLRVDARLTAPDWRVQWERALAEATELGVSLEVALHLPRQGEAGLSEAAGLLAREADRVARVLALRDGESATQPGTIAAVRRALGGCRVSVGAGSDCNFCELNREQAQGQLGRDAADFLFWSVCPQVHATDSLSVMETLEAQPATVATARAFADGRPLVVSPVTFKQRFNPVATGAELPPPPGELPPQTDPRQLSRFGAAWTLASVARLAEAGVASVTCYETTGWRGVLEKSSGSPNPEKFPSQPGQPFPIYEVFAALAGFSRFAVAPFAATEPVVALALFDEVGLRRLLLANTSDRSGRVSLPKDLGLSPGRKGWARALLDDSPKSPGGDTVLVDAADWIELSPYGFVQLDRVEGELGGAR